MGSGIIHCASLEYLRDHCFRTLQLKTLKNIDFVFLLTVRVIPDGAVSNCANRKVGYLFWLKRNTTEFQLGSCVVPVRMH